MSSPGELKSEPWIPEMLPPQKKEPAAGRGRLRRVLIVTGKVQRVGFRGMVVDIAQELGVGGSVQNIPDGTVRVVCAGSPELLDSFESRIRIRDRLVQVAEITRQSESTANGTSNTFKVIPDSAAQEALEAGATGAKYLKLVAETLATVGTGVQSMNQGMRERFDNLEARYGEIGATANAIADFLRQIHAEQVGQRTDQESHRAQMAQLIENNNRAVAELTVAVRELRSNGGNSR
jgi:acylphosphatase